MTELHFKGKEFVYNHHLAVPHRPLVPDVTKSVGTPDLAGNLIIQGDNLHALKSLLPIYAGKVDCIFIDPPYNTGNEGWCYNDHVNAPMIKEWLKDNPIGIDDGLRHDKWCAMMWPRLKLLYELLSETGFIFVCIDDNEVSNLRSILEEIYKETGFVSNIIKQSKIGGGSDSIHIVKEHEYGIIFAKDISKLEAMFVDFDESYLKRYKEIDDNGRYFWDTFARSGLKNPIRYEVTAPDGEKINDDWIRSKKRFLEDLEKGEIKFKKLTSGKWSVQFKQYLNEKGKKPRSLEIASGGTIDGKKELGQIFGNDKIFPYPKSFKYPLNIIKLMSNKNALILDSFAGSGTTAHAVLEANKLDGGNRKFILVEMEEDIANDVTAKRMRRVIDGYEFTGKQTTELYQKKLTWSVLNKDNFFPFDIITDIKNQHGTQFDRITGDVNKDNTFIISGENDVKEKTKGLGGTFTYCTLGDAIDIDKILTGENLPTYEDIAPVLFHMATNQTLDPKKCRPDDFLVGASLHETVWMIYKPDLNWLKSDAAALTLSRAKTIFQTDPTRRHLVFAPARFVGEKVLREAKLNVAYVPFPDALYRLVREE